MKVWIAHGSTYSGDKIAVCFSHKPTREEVELALDKDYSGERDAWEYEDEDEFPGWNYELTERELRE